MVKEMAVDGFLEDLSSKKPTPGGGGASALGGALGASLGLMVVNLTLGKKKYVQVEEEFLGYLERLTALREDFLRLADEDALAFAPLARAYGLPAETEEERLQKETVLEVHLFRAAMVPIQVMETAIRALDMMDSLAEKGSRPAVSDVGAAVQFIRTSITGAIMNVWINTKSMKNREKANELNEYADTLLKNGTEKADFIYRTVEAALR